MLARRCGSLGVLFDPGPDSDDSPLAGARSKDLRTVIDSGGVSHDRFTRSRNQAALDSAGAWSMLPEIGSPRKDEQQQALPSHVVLDIFWAASNCTVVVCAQWESHGHQRRISQGSVVWGVQGFLFLLVMRDL